MEEVEEHPRPSEVVAPRILHGLARFGSSVSVRRLTVPESRKPKKRDPRDLGRPLLLLDLREMGRSSLCVVDEKVAASRRHFRQKPAV